MFASFYCFDELVERLWEQLPYPRTRVEVAAEGEIAAALAGAVDRLRDLPAQRAAAIVKATTFFDDPDVLAKVSRGLGEAMVGINVDDVPVDHRLAERGW